VAVNTPKLPLFFLLVTLFLGLVNVLHVNVITMAEATLIIPRTDAFKPFDHLRMIRDTLFFDLNLWFHLPVWEKRLNSFKALRKTKKMPKTAKRHGSMEDSTSGTPILPGRPYNYNIRGSYNLNSPIGMKWTILGNI
jgi:hypothetical protein